MSETSYNEYTEELPSNIGPKIRELSQTTNENVSVYKGSNEGMDSKQYYIIHESDIDYKAKYTVVTTFTEIDINYMFDITDLSNIVNISRKHFNTINQRVKEVITNQIRTYFTTDTEIEYDITFIGKNKIELSPTREFQEIIVDIIGDYVNGVQSTELLEQRIPDKILIEVDFVDESTN